MKKLLSIMAGVAILATSVPSYAINQNGITTESDRISFTTKITSLCSVDKGNANTWNPEIRKKNGKYYLYSNPSNTVDTRSYVQMLGHSKLRINAAFSTATKLQSTWEQPIHYLDILVNGEVKEFSATGNSSSDAITLDTTGAVTWIDPDKYAMQSFSGFKNNKGTTVTITLSCTK